MRYIAKAHGEKISYIRSNSARMLRASERASGGEALSGEDTGRKAAAARQRVTDVDAVCCRRYPTLQGGRLDDGG